MGAALKFKDANLPRQDSERARLKVIRGPDLGVTFVIRGGRAYIGRGEENDIVLSDFKASRRHAEILANKGGWLIKDSGSSNGITVNGKPVKPGADAVLNTKDTFALGDSLFEFMSEEAPTMMLKAAPTNEDQIRAEQAKFEAQRAKIHAMSKMGGLAKNRPLANAPSAAQVFAQQAKATSKAVSAQGAEPRKLILAVAGLVVAYMLIASDSAPVKKFIKKKKSQEQEILLPPDDMDITPQVEKAADVFFKMGFREFEHGNFLRARTQFETVLQVDPNHALAKLYLINANNKIDSEVRSNLDMGRRDFKSGKLKLARGHFEYVMRLLYRDQNNPAFNEAKDNLANVLKAMEGT